MRDIKDYTDENGFIGHYRFATTLEEMDYGDSSQRTFTKILAKLVQRLYIEKGELTAEEIQEINRQAYSLVLETSNGVQLVRHPDRKKWWGQIWTGSGDAVRPVMYILIIMSEHSITSKMIFIKLLKALNEREGFFWNYKKIWPDWDWEPKVPDYSPPLERASWNIRAKRQKGLGNTLLLFLSDFRLFFMSLILLWRSWRDPKHTTDDLNHHNDLVTRGMVMPTPVVKVARWIYSHRLGASPTGSKDDRIAGYGPRSAFLSYYDEPKDPPMYDVVAPFYQSGLV